MAVGELVQSLSPEGQGLVRVADDHALPVDHVGQAVLADVDAAEYVVQGVVFIDPDYIKDAFPVLLHGHSHGHAQLALKNRGGVGGHIIGLLEQGQEIVRQMLRRAVDALHQPAVQVVQRDGVQLVDFRRLGQKPGTAGLCSG